MSNTAEAVRTKSEALALLKETVDFYGENPNERRSINVDSRPVYYGSSGGPRRCAVGRHLVNPAEIDRLFNSNNIDTIRESMPVGFENIFKPEARGYPIEFWTRLQVLHDSCENWSDTGLSFAGADEVNNITGWIQRESNLLD